MLSSVIYLNNEILLLREISCIVFRPFNAQLLDLVDERNTWENGLTGLQTWRSSSKRKNGNLGSYQCLILEYLTPYNDEKCLLLFVVHLIMECSFSTVKLVHPRGDWSLA